MLEEIPGRSFLAGFGRGACFLREVLPCWDPSICAEDSHCAFLLQHHTERLESTY